MKKIVGGYLMIALLITACSNSPQEYFGTASLNCNLLFGFAGQGMENELENPSAKLVDEKTMATASMTRHEIIESKIKTAEANFEKVKSLRQTGDAKNMILASITLYEFVLPVYKNEYKQLATLYDTNAGAEQIEALKSSIRHNYALKFDELYNAVVSSGIDYAQKHGIQVQTVSPVPQR